MRRTVLGLLDVHRLRALRIWRVGRWLLDTVASPARLPRSQSAGLRLASRLRRLSHIACPGHCRSVALKRASRRDGLLPGWVAPVILSATAVAISLGLCAISLVPAAIEQRWVQIRQATDDPGL